jgi:hypothetical protein
MVKDTARLSYEVRIERVSLSTLIPGRASIAPTPFPAGRWAEGPEPNEKLPALARHWREQAKEVLAAIAAAWSGVAAGRNWRSGSNRRGPPARLTPDRNADALSMVVQCARLPHGSTRGPRSHRTRRNHITLGPGFLSQTALPSTFGASRDRRKPTNAMGRWAETAIYTHRLARHGAFYGGAPTARRCTSQTCLATSRSRSATGPKAE